jgi:hypothetical protein
VKKEGDIEADCENQREAKGGSDMGCRGDFEGF